jgi:phosphate-selective porin OprO/OprP
MVGALKLGVTLMVALAVPGNSAFAQDKKAEPKTVSDEKPKEPAPKEEPPISVTLRDGIHFKSADGNLDSTLSGYVGVHYRVFTHRPDDNVRTSPDTWYLRQARFDLYGDVYKDFDFRIVFDVSTGSGPGSTATLTDGYFGWKRYPALSFRVGQFKEPFGQDQTTPDRVIEFNERSEGDRFVPARDIGAMVYGRLFDGTLGYELGTFNGNGRGVVDSNKGKEVAGRIRVMPFAAGPGDALFRNLRFGVAATAGTLQDSSIGGLDATSMYLNVLYLDSTAGTIDGTRKRLGGEFNWNTGPFGLRAEAWRRVDHVDVGPLDNARVPITAWNASATWILTGETKPLEARITPAHVLEPSEGSWGALEAAVRVDRLRFGNEIFATGVASAAGNSNAVTGYTLAVNWYLSRHIRISPNIYWEVYDDPIAFAGGRTDRHFFGGILRFQLEF